MISDQLLLILGRHALEGIEGTLEVTFEGCAGLDDLVHDLITLSLGLTGAEGEFSQVAANTDTGGDDHSGLILGEHRAVHLGAVHGGDVGGIGSVTVVVLDDLVEEVRESLVGVVGTSVAANAGVNVLAARENALFERDTASILLVLILFPVFLGEETSNRGFLVGLGEERETDDVVGVLEPGTAVSAAFDGSGHFEDGTAVATSRGRSATHLCVKWK